jgi:hypothetical protein
MRVLSRIFFVLLLLGGLGYGSYAFGRYVLSASLFGAQVVPTSNSGLAVVSGGGNKVVTRKTDLKGGKPRVELEVLPAEQAGPSPEPPSLEDLQKSASERSYTPRPTRSATKEEDGPRVRRRFDEGKGYSLSEGEEEGDRPRRRRRRRRRTTESSRTEGSSSAERTARSEAASSGSSSGSSSSGSSSNGSFSSDDTPRVLNENGDSVGFDRSETREVSSGSERRSRRRRSTESSSESSSGSSRTRETPRRRERTIESPVPRAESSGGSSGGGESPVPVPE